MASSGPRELKELRRSELLRWKGVKEKLAHEEALLHAKLHPEIETVVADEHIFLFKWMLRFAEHE